MPKKVNLDDMSRLNIGLKSALRDGLAKAQEVATCKK